MAGLLAQWAPDPLLVAYLPHLAVVALVLAPGLRAPETVPAQQPGTDALGARRPPPPPVASCAWSAQSAPWVFAAPSIAFAVLPAMIAAELGHFQIGFAALTAALTLAAGVLIQPLARRIDRASPGRGLLTGLAATLAGLALAVLAVALGSWPLALPADVLLGAGYGLCLVSGLIEVQGLAAPGELASLTAIFYALTYVGFAAPIAIAELEHLMRPAVVLLAGVGLLALVHRGVRAAMRRAPAGPGYGMSMVDESGVLARGPWEPGDIEVGWRSEPFAPSAETIEAADRALQELRGRGSPSHDGLAARMVGFEVSPDGRLQLELQPIRWALRLLPGRRRRGQLSALCVVRDAEGSWLAGRRAAWVASWAGRWALGRGRLGRGRREPGRHARARARGGVERPARAAAGRGADPARQRHDDVRRAGVAAGRAPASRPTTSTTSSRGGRAEVERWPARGRRAAALHRRAARRG